MRRNVFRILLAASVFAMPIDANAISLGVKAGIDKRTQNFLNNYPAVVREQFVLSIQQSLPLVDKSIDKTFDRLDESVNNGAAKIQCIMGGAPPIVGDAAGQIIGKIKNKPTGATATTNLLAFAEHRRDKIDGKTTTTDSLARYGDILASVYQVQCAFNGAPPELTDTIIRLTADYYSSMRVWQFVDSLECGSSDNCFNYIHKFTQSVIAGADPRDVAAARADVRFATLPGEGSHLVKGGFEGAKANAKKREITLRTYEHSAREMRAIQHDIAIASMQRAEQALQFLNGREAEIAKNEAAYAAMAVNFSIGPSTVITDAVMGGPAPGNGLALRDAIAAIDLSEAAALSDAEAVLARQAVLESRRKSLLAQTDDIVTGYGARLKRAQDDEAAAAAKAKAEKNRFGRDGTEGPHGGGGGAGIGGNAGGRL